MFFYIGCGLLAADLRQASAPGLEPLQSASDGALGALIRFRLVGAYWVGICLVRVARIRVRLTGVLRIRVWLTGVLRTYVLWRRVGLIRVSLGRIRLVRVYVTRVSL